MRTTKKNNNKIEYRSVTKEEVEKLVAEGKLRPEDIAKDNSNAKVTVKFFTTPRKPNS